ncbi:hypothetical protein EDB89DRAFT_1952617 [Lactarius sanguifluus]|nr:hypothetical protein EDB89DRAFT_1952617 [Lactarius sanguifluus]
MESAACLVCLLQACFKGESVLVLSVLHIYRISLFPFPFAVIPLFLSSKICVRLCCHNHIYALLFHLSSPRLVSLVACVPLPVYIPYRIVPYYNT